MKRKIGALGAGGGLLLVSLLLYAVNLRGPVIAVAPVVEPVRQALGLDLPQAGLLTSLPVLCFALAAPLASLLLARIGPVRAVVWSSLGIIAGTVLRSADGAWALFAGTVVIGLAMTIGNVVVPVIIGREFRSLTGVVTGAYASALNIGSMLTSSLTAPLAVLAGWRWALALWSLPVVAALVLWRIAVRRRGLDDGEPKPATASAATKVERFVSAWRRPKAWGLTLAFACHTFSYFGLTAWFPKILMDLLGMGASAAGLAASLFQTAALACSVAVPLALRFFSARVVLLGIWVLWSTLPLGLLLAPSGWMVWSTLAGMAQGGTFTVIFYLIVTHSMTPADARSQSAMVQGGGYAVAAVGPYVLGAVHVASAGWTVPFLLVLVVLLGIVPGTLLGTWKGLK